MDILEDIINKETLLPLWEAFKELLLTTIIATLPLWGTYLALSISSEDIFDFERLLMLIKDGNLFLYSATTLAPVIYLVSKKRANSIMFPGNVIFIILTVLVAIVASFIIAFNAIKSEDISYSLIDGSI